MRVILTTVGTSLLSNAKRTLGRLRQDTVSSEELTLFINNETDEKASAETNTLSRLLRPTDQLVFVCSETSEGILVSECLCAFYQRQGYNAQIVKLTGLNYDDGQFKVRGLRSLAKEMCHIIITGQQAAKEVCINATGGFKAEAAYAALTGLMFNTPIYYIHEAFHDIVEMPAMPITWDFSLFADHEWFFEWIQKQRRTSKKVSRHLESLPSAIQEWLAPEEQYTVLSAAGETAFAAYQMHLWKVKDVPLWLSTTALKTYETADVPAKLSIQNILRKIRSRELRAMGSEQVRGCDCLAYPKNNREYQVLYFEDADGALRICEIKILDLTFVSSRNVHRDDYADDAFIQWQAAAD